MNGTKIEFLRNIRGYTQEYVAKKSNIEINKYKRIESNKVTKVIDADLKKIAETLGTTFEDLKSPNPFIMIHIQDSPNSLGNGNQYYGSSERVEKILEKKDEQIDRLIKINENKDKMIEQVFDNYNKLLKS
jgi:transcriptional regulator with XRE-family HTH domain